MSTQFANKVAFITGAAQGQGRGHAVRFAEVGADIIAVDICEQIDSVGSSMATRDDLGETVYLVEKTGRRIVAEQADVRDIDRLKTVVDNGVAELGRLDFVLANAGSRRSSTTWPISPRRFAMRWTCCSTGCLSPSRLRYRRCWRTATAARS
jgi:NAD(P)-dependent dehydrogenase (short-subunit alcohol dehydrogenase family)